MLEKEKEGKGDQPQSHYTPSFRWRKRNMSYSVPWSGDKEDGTTRWLALALFRVAWTRLMGQPGSTGHVSLALQTRPSDE
ncbi:hypothetical protein CEP54_005666 [Fusarium duplospermum]|uniref:Uncharacterized protein n=1 Tax=Fusarium duplospermum TaxID=1325734 RepID=A0A428QB71_9HYPO|nr:hypothetical protein CEP54_005666 [Fusarium duplospermum]